MICTVVSGNGVRTGMKLIGGNVLRIRQALNLARSESTAVEVGGADLNFAGPPVVTLLLLLTETKILVFVFPVFSRVTESPFFIPKRRTLKRIQTVESMLPGSNATSPRSVGKRHGDYIAWEMRLLAAASLMLDDTKL